MDARRLICVIGGGISGLVFAALHKSRGGEVLVLEKDDIDSAAEDGKSVVINAAAAAVLRQAGANLPNAAPLSTARISFQNAPGGATFCGGVLGIGIAHREARRELAAALGDSFRAPVSVSSFTPQPDSVRVLYRAADGTEEIAEAAAVVVACAAPDLPPPFVARETDYRQAIITFAAETKSFPRGLAVESFTAIGIVALVPRTDGKTGVVVCAGERAAGALSALPDGELLTKINDCFGGEFALHTAGERFIYAPKARRVSPLAAERVAMLGAGATILHPAGAQGLSLGIADAECLAALLRTNPPPRAFSEYRRRRTRAHCTMFAATSILAAGGHLRASPFRIIGGITTAALSIPLRQFATQFRV